MEEKFLTQHPQAGKSGVNINKAKYDLIRDSIIETLRTHGRLTFTELADQIGEKLEGNFEGSVSWYVVTVKLDLEARGIIERVPKTRPEQLQLAEA